MSFEYTLERSVRSPGEIENAVGLLQSDLPQANEVVLMAYMNPIDVSYCFNVQWMKHGETSYKSLVFLFPWKEYGRRSYAVLKTVAESSKTLKSLEASNMNEFNCTELQSVLIEFGNAGYWSDSLETLYLKGWDLGSGASCVAFSHLQSFPSKLKHLYYAATSDPPQLFLAGFLKHLPELKTMYLHSFTNEESRTACGSLSNLGSIESIQIGRWSLSTEAGDQLMHAVLFHTQIRILILHSHTPGPLGITSLISYLRCADITVHSLVIDFDAKDHPALELAFEERLGALAIEDVEPAPSRSNLRYRRPIPRTPVPRPSMIHEYLRIFKYKKIWDCKKTVESVRPVILAKFTGPTHRTKLFTLLHRQTDIFRPKDKRVEDSPSS
jgi:hypothetical protein